LAQGNAAPRLRADNLMTVALPRREAERAVPSAIEARFRQVVEHCEESLRPRVAMLLDAAAEAIHLLQDLQLVPLEEADSGAPQSLAAWEELAPVMGQTVESVNRLV